MPDETESTPACAPGAIPCFPRVKPDFEQAASELREACAGVPSGRLHDAIRDLAVIAGGSAGTTGDQVIDDCMELNFDGPRYLFVNPKGERNEE